MNRFRSYAAVLFLIVLVLFSLGSSFSALQAARSHWKFSGDLLDDPILMANRLKLLEAKLPPSGTIGYLSEQDIPGLGFDLIDQDEEFAMTQYALAPRILIRAADQPLVIVNLPYQTTQAMQNFMAPFGLTLVQKFDFGLYLYRH